MAILLLLYLTQLNYNYLSTISVKLISFLQENKFKRFLQIISFIVCYGIFIFILVALFAYIFLVNPNFVRKATILTFFSWTVGLFSFLKMFLGELRPYMFAQVFTSSTVSPWDCETDFGMPSAHMILVVSTYYAYKIVFYCEEQQLKLTNKTQRVEI